MKRLNSRNKTTPFRKQKIIKSALYCFNHKGFTVTSMADISKKSMTSIGSLYHHFKSKEQLASSIYIEGLASYQNSLLENIIYSKGMKEIINTIIHFHITWSVDNKEWALFLFKNRHSDFILGYESEIKELNKKFAGNIYNYFKPYFNSEIKEYHVDIFMNILLGPPHEYVRLFLSNKHITEPKQAIIELSDAIWYALKVSSGNLL